MHTGRIISILILFSLCAFAQDEENAVGFLQAMEGVVQIQKGTGFEETVEGKALFEGDKIIVQKGGRARIAFDDENAVNLGEETEFEIIEYGLDRDEDHVLLKLLKGSVNVFVNKKYDGQKSTFNFQTKSAVVSVRGTEFAMTYVPDRDETEVSVKSGEVQLGRELAGNRIVNPEKVRAGFFGKFLQNSATPLISKSDSAHIQNLNTKLFIKLSDKNKKLKREWQLRRKDVFENRRLFRQQKIKAAKEVQPAKSQSK